MKKLSLLLSLTAVAFYSKSQTMILAKDVAQYVGKNVSICDSVYSAKALDKLTLINLGGAYPKELITIVINKEDERKFPSEPSSMFIGNNVCVTGVVSDFKGKKQIVVTDPKQIVVK
ncbi:hypothetical protein [uncultured Pedobacter sp.]|uniref:hypothetical protein n=1 Tax=uncultured Pedobacter sp. TaxID=246139 RepID=UPI0025DDF7B6|nr:hypothetical protein [uncultured Pedobacter sp.]